MGGKEIPDECFLHTQKQIGVVSGRKTWSNEDGSRLYQWDSLHGEVEVYNKRGQHLGVQNVSGFFIKEQIKGRRIDVK
ncbi:colicin E3/pyocin S6 family cytotoxin [Leptospira kanakyensis]|uniref:colicin E3/pyocin S6 family cytotoxin n=1 Tax=Leptospira kanakyensis TaxID=2484968 RepID=UPI00223D8F08|nr:colicin E3/pyocin S6 family cytotoxin [Leptospira kanakyensis]MCW7469598.1 colicin E3/pyocin S6 family cytotoxin [Leptospira kanakyensis]